ncbi:MAG TPA: protein tyrosine phosphatase family protein [Blastocatellia bacterium]|nr:protein tyrosine phosphatase family protein [Blastocatellia bacterium]
MKKAIVVFIGLTFLASVSLAYAGQKSERLAGIEQSLKDDVPRILCVDESFATAGQPKETAFAKLATNGFRSVLNLRTDAEGIDLARERETAEKAGLRYINVPVSTQSLGEETVAAFIKAVKDKSNHPMLIHCGTANRVGAMMMIFRVLDQGWTEEKALEEATAIGLTSPNLKKFAQDYIATHKKGSK